MNKTNIKTLTCFFLIIIFLISGLSGCKQSEQNDYPEYSVVDNKELGCAELHYDGIVYRPYGVFTNNDFKGKQIGVREDDPEVTICEVKGYESDEWILDHLDVFMSGGDMLFKAAGVVEIPPELAKYKQYDY